MCCFDVNDQSGCELLFTLENIPFSIVHCGDKNKISIAYYLNHFLFVVMACAPNELSLRKKAVKDHFMFIYCEGQFTWRNGNHSETLLSGGVISLNCNENITCHFTSRKTLCVFFVPFSFDKRLTQANLAWCMKKLGDHPLGGIAYDLISSIYVGDDLFDSKILAFLSLVSLISVSDSDSFYKKNLFACVLELMRKNVNNPDLSLSFLANKLAVSRSKLQKEFYKNDTTYRNELKKIRLNKLVDYFHPRCSFR